jgi:hypothetical protein
MERRVRSIVTDRDCTGLKYRVNTRRNRKKPQRRSRHRERGKLRQIKIVQLMRSGKRLDAAGPFHKPLALLSLLHAGSAPSTAGALKSEACSRFSHRARAALAASAERLLRFCSSVRLIVVAVPEPAHCPDSHMWQYPGQAIMFSGVCYCGKGHGFSERECINYWRKEAFEHS